MDNQYNYYRPDSDENRGADNQQGFGAGPQQNPKAPKPKKGYAKKVALVVGAAVLFGAVGGVTMQGTSYLTGKLLGKNTKSTVGTTKTVSNAKLTTSTSTVTSDVSDIVENTLPSIVSITNMSVQEVQNFFGGISQQESESAGSGIIISQNDSELLVVTNNHVVEGSDTLTVTFNDGNSVEAQIKGTDSARDLAVVAVPLDKISDDTMNAIKVATLGDSDSLKVDGMVEFSELWNGGIKRLLFSLKLKLVAELLLLKSIVDFFGSFIHCRHSITRLRLTGQALHRPFCGLR